jgi:hypothetical protein
MEATMILVRNIFQAKYGKGGELAKQSVAMMQSMGAESGTWRVLSDLTSGPFDTIVAEFEVPSLAEWERIRAEMFANPSPDDSMNQMDELIVSGRAELYTIEGQS